MLVDAVVLVELPASLFAFVLVVEGGDAPGGFLAVGVDEQRQKKPASLLLPLLQSQTRLLL